MNYLLFQTILTPGFFLLVAIVFLAGALLFYTVFRKTKEIEDKEKDVFSNYDAILKEARQKAVEIIAHATDEGSRIEFESKTIQIEAGQKEEQAFTSVVKEHEEHLKKQAEVLHEMYDKSLESLKQQYVLSVDQAVKGLEEKTFKNVDEIKAITDQATGTGKDSLEKKIEEEFSKAKIEISEYKRQKIEKFQGNIQGILLQICRDLLGRSIPLEEHQNLVIEALEKAQKEHMFD